MEVDEVDGVARVRTCFLIGQMTRSSDMDRLRRLRDVILAPYLESMGYVVELPDDPGVSPDIISSVMRRIDSADIVVADLTGNNPNVYYELGARHSLGLPYVLVQEETNRLRFDLAHLACERYPKGLPDDAEKTATATRRIETRLEEAHDAASESRFVENPISGYYRRPLAEISPAAGLALGYFQNFLRFVVDDIHADADSVQVREADADGDRPGDDDRWADISDGDRVTAHVEVWIPRQLSGAYHKDIVRSYLRGGLLDNARFIKRPRRTFELYARKRERASDPLVFVDIPTAVNAMEFAVTDRIPMGERDDRAIRMALESQEISRFRTALKRYMLHDAEHRRAMEFVTLPPPETFDPARIAAAPL